MPAALTSIALQKKAKPLAFMTVRPPASVISLEASPAVGGA